MERRRALGRSGILGILFLLPSSILARDLTFDERVQAQEAIERVYYSHQVGTTKPFEEAVPRSVLVDKVRTYLKQIVALESFWNRPITSDMIREELERMARQSRMPERLGELYAALGNDPLLVGECLARPALAGRLARNLFAYDRVIHADERLRAETLRAQLVSRTIDPWSDYPDRTVSDLVRGEPGTGSAGRALRDGSPLNLSPEEYDALSERVPGLVGEIGSLIEDPEMFVVRVVLKREATALRVANFVVRKRSWDDWWAAVEPGLDSASVGSVAAGADPLPRPSGSICDSTDTWEMSSLDGAPGPRAHHTAVWTGSVMIVWGGLSQGSVLNDGGRYDPATDDWAPTSTLNAPAGRSDHLAVWTGSEMIVWGGTGPGAINVGGRYEPASDSWRPTSTTNAPAALSFSTAVWTGSQMVVWGGLDRAGSLPRTGGRYDPASDTWQQTSATNAPTGRYSHTAVWTGSEMIIWGGVDVASALNTGSRYDPGRDSWRPLPMTNGPAARSFHTAVWTGSLMVVWGGVPSGLHPVPLGTGGRYNLAGNSWSSISATNAPQARYGHTAVWTGSRMVLWGGFAAFPGATPHPNLNTGGTYDPSADAWTVTSRTNAPVSRDGHAALWADPVMIVWGGFGATGSVLDSGGRYCACAAALFHRDQDGDGYGDPGVSVESCSQPTGYVIDASDCDDANPAVHPGALETCDGIDDNCDGRIDEGFGVGQSCTAPADACHQIVGTMQCRPDGTGSECSGPVSFHDAAPPTITCPADTVLECPATTAGAGLATAADACDSAPAVVSNAPAVLPLGTNLVIWTATDRSGNRASCQQSVRVRDTLPPVLSVVADPASLWPPNHQLIPVRVGWQVHDLCDQSPVVTLVSVASSEPEDASGDIVGADLGTPDGEIGLRAERAGKGPGRVYELTYRAVDASGNATLAIGIVTVPHDQGSGPGPLPM